MQDDYEPINKLCIQIEKLLQIYNAMDLEYYYDLGYIGEIIKQLDYAYTKHLENLQWVKKSQ
jgi:hypothetical protein